MSSFPPSSFSNLRNQIRSFIHERDWEQFHNPKNLAMSIAIEAAELMECFQWKTDGNNISIDEKQHAIDELADVLIYCLALTNILDIDDLEAAVLEKLARSGEKYPVKDYKGKL